MVSLSWNAVCCMKSLCIAILLLCLPVSARQPKPAPKQPVAAPTAPAMAPQRTVEEDNQLKLWIADIMETADKSTARADLAEKHADAAEAEAKASRDQGAIAIERLANADRQLTEIQRQYDALQKEVADLKDQIKKDAVKINRFYKLCTVLSVIAASLAALAVFLMMKPGGIIGTLASFTSPMLYGAPVVVWVLVFAAAQVYLRYVF